MGKKFNIKAIIIITLSVLTLLGLIGFVGKGGWFGGVAGQQLVVREWIQRPTRRSAQLTRFRAGELPSISCWTDEGC